MFAAFMIGVVVGVAITIGSIVVGLYLAYRKAAPAVILPW